MEKTHKYSTQSKVDGELKTFEYEINAFTGHKATRMAHRFIKHIGPALAAAVDGNEQVDDDTPMKIEFSKVLEAFFDNCSETQLMEFIDDMYANVNCIGIGVLSNKVWNLHFHARLKDHMNLLVECCKYQFSDFLDEWLDTTEVASLTPKRITLKD